MLNQINLEKLKPEFTNLTGVRLLVLFALLLESPKTFEEINDYFKTHNYPNNDFSIDTLRNDLKSLRDSGCIISRADKSYGNKYHMTANPFELNISTSVVKSLWKIYDKICPYLDCQELLKFDKLFHSLSIYSKNDYIAEQLQSISLLRNVDKSIFKDLVKAKELNCKISFKYRTANKIRKLKMLVEDIEIRSKKLYITGYCYNYNSNTFFMITKIISPIKFYLQKNETNNQTQTIIYELKNMSFRHYKETSEEIIKERTDDKIIIEYKSNNEFKMMQKILYYGDDCTVISPSTFREKIINTLKEMQKLYE